MSEEEKKACTGKLVVTHKGWEFRPDPGTECEKALQTLKELGPAARSYVKSHVKPADEKQQAALKEVT